MKNWVQYTTPSMSRNLGRVQFDAELADGVWMSVGNELVVSTNKDDRCYIQSDLLRDGIRPFLAFRADILESWLLERGEIVDVFSGKNAAGVCFRPDENPTSKVVGLALTIPDAYGEVVLRIMGKDLGVAQ